MIAQQADFYGAMDGASKFVKGDAIAGVLITGINIVGGMFIGVVQRGLPIAQAASTYTILTVGEGLVAQIPALDHLHRGRAHGHARRPADAHRLGAHGAD